MRVHAAGKAGENRAHQEGRDLVARGVDAHGLGGDFIIGHGDEAATVSGIDHGPNHVHGHRGKPECPEQVGVGGNSDHSARPAHSVDVLQHHADDFAKAQGDDGQVVALESQRGHTDDESGNRSSQPTHQQRQREQQPLLLPSSGSNAGPKLVVNIAAA